jgi:hypothetical protein
VVKRDNFLRGKQNIPLQTYVKAFKTISIDFTRVFRREKYI